MSYFQGEINAIAWYKDATDHGRPQKFLQVGGQSQHFAYLFQFVGDATMGAILLQNVGGQLGVKPI